MSNYFYNNVSVIGRMYIGIQFSVLIYQWTVPTVQFVHWWMKVDIKKSRHVNLRTIIVSGSSNQRPRTMVNQLRHLYAIGSLSRRYVLAFQQIYDFGWEAHRILHRSKINWFQQWYQWCPSGAKYWMVNGLTLIEPIVKGSCWTGLSESFCVWWFSLK